MDAISARDENFMSGEILMLRADRLANDELRMYNEAIEMYAEAG